jgi:DNA-directed RNA polymerase subunit RPC12/RpoP
MTPEQGEGSFACSNCGGTLFEYDQEAEGSKCIGCGLWISGTLRGIFSV